MSNADCTFDGTMAAFSLAYYKKCMATEADEIDLFVPIVNVTRYLLPTRASILHYFSKLNISPELLICV